MRELRLACGVKNVVVEVSGFGPAFPIRKKQKVYSAIRTA